MTSPKDRHSVPNDTPLDGNDPVGWTSNLFPSSAVHRFLEGRYEGSPALQQQQQDVASQQNLPGWTQQDRTSDQETSFLMKAPEKSVMSQKAKPSSIAHNPSSRMMVSAAVQLEDNSSVQGTSGKQGYLGQAVRGEGFEDRAGGDDDDNYKAEQPLNAAAAEWNQTTRQLYPCTVQQRGPDNMDRFQGFYQNHMEQQSPASFVAQADPVVAAAPIQMMPRDESIVDTGSYTYNSSTLYPVEPPQEQVLACQEEEVVEIDDSALHSGGMSPSGLVDPHFLGITPPPQYLHYPAHMSLAPRHNLHFAPSQPNVWLPSAAAVAPSAPTVMPNNNSWYHPDQQPYGSLPLMFPLPAPTATTTENYPSVAEGARFAFESQEVSSRNNYHNRDWQTPYSNIRTASDESPTTMPGPGFLSSSTTTNNKKGSSPCCVPSLDAPPFKKKKRDKDKPKRPLSAYNIFFKEERAKMLQEASCSAASPEKKKKKTTTIHVATATLDEPGDRIQDTATTSDTAPSSSPTKRCEITSEETKQKRKQVRVGISFEQMAKKIGARWKTIDPVRLDEYKTRAEEDKKRYTVEMAAYSTKKQIELEAARVQLESTVPEETRRRYLDGGGAGTTK